MNINYHDIDHYIVNMSDDTPACMLSQYYYQSCDQDLQHSYSPPTFAYLCVPIPATYIVLPTLGYQICTVYTTIILSTVTLWKSHVYTSCCSNIQRHFLIRSLLNVGTPSSSEFSQLCIIINFICSPPPNPISSTTSL